MTKRFLSVAVLIAAVALPGGVVPGCKSKQRPKKAWVTRGYWIIDVRASKEWLAAHEVRAVLDDGNEYRLPVVFRGAPGGDTSGGMQEDEGSGTLRFYAGARTGKTLRFYAGAWTGKLVCFPEAEFDLTDAIFDIDALAGDDISFVFISYYGPAPAEAVSDIDRPSDEYITDLLSRAVMIDVSP